MDALTIWVGDMPTHIQSSLSSISLYGNVICITDKKYSNLNCIDVKEFKSSELLSGTIRYDSFSDLLRLEYLSYNSNVLYIDADFYFIKDWNNLIQQTKTTFEYDNRNGFVGNGLIYSGDDTKIIKEMYDKSINTTTKKFEFYLDLINETALTYKDTINFLPNKLFKFSYYWYAKRFAENNINEKDVSSVINSNLYGTHFYKPRAIPRTECPELDKFAGMLDARLNRTPLIKCIT